MVFCTEVETDHYRFSPGSCNDLYGIAYHYLRVWRRIRKRQSVAIAGLLASGANIIAAVVGTDFWINLIDRALAMVIAFAVVKVIPDRTLIKYSLGANFTKKKSE